MGFAPVTCPTAPNLEKLYYPDGRIIAGAARQGRWPGLAPGFELVRDRTEKGQTTIEVVYGITSLRPQQADAKQLLRLVQGH
jgi:hypothetical protein